MSSQPGLKMFWEWNHERRGIQLTMHSGHISLAGDMEATSGDWVTETRCCYRSPRPEAQPWDSQQTRFRHQPSRESNQSEMSGREARKQFIRYDSKILHVLNLKIITVNDTSLGIPSRLLPVLWTHSDHHACHFLKQSKSPLSGVSFSLNALSPFKTFIFRGHFLRKEAETVWCQIQWLR